MSFQEIQKGLLIWKELSSREKNAIVIECEPKIKSILYSKGFRKYFFISTIVVSVYIIAKTIIAKLDYASSPV